MQTKNWLLKKLNQALYASTKLLQTTSALHWGIKDCKDKVDSYLLLQSHILDEEPDYSSLLYTNGRDAAGFSNPGGLAVMWWA